MKRKFGNVQELTLLECNLEHVPTVRYKTSIRIKSETKYLNFV